MMTFRNSGRCEMSGDPGELLKRAAGIATRSIDVGAIVRRGTSLKRRRFAYVTGTAVLSLVALTLGGIALSHNRPPVPSSVGVQRSNFVIYRSQDPTFSIRYPRSWYRARSSLTPNLSSPHELFSIGTRPLNYRGTDCAHLPKSALQDLTATDSFISVEESGGPGFPARPADFRTSARPVGGFECVARRAPLDVYWLNFRDSGRQFYALIAIGKRASEAVKSQTWAALNSFSTTKQPRKPLMSFGPKTCTRSSPLKVHRPGFVDVTPIVEGGSARAVVMEGRPFPAKAKIKMVWKLTGSGPLHLFATGASKEIAPLQLSEHSYPGLEGPGDEWGTVFEFRTAGCYVVHAERATASAYIKILIR
jgi:hypothetical protein